MDSGRVQAVDSQAAHFLSFFLTPVERRDAEGGIEYMVTGYPMFL